MISIGFIYPQHSAYILCEGNYQSANASLWIVGEGGNLTEGPNNPVGDTGQSMTVEGNRLYIINNGSSSIEVYDISENGSLTHYQTINTNFSGPREMVVLDGIGYITEWYSESIAVLDLWNLEFFEPISVTGMPEDIVTDGTYLYASIVQNSDWSAGNQVLRIDPSSNEIIESYTVGYGPGQMLIHNNFLFVTNVYYDENWNTYSGTSKINLESGDVVSADHGVTTSFNADIAIVNDYIYRMWETGIQRLDPFLNFADDSQIGNYSDIYSMSVFENKLYLGLSDYVAPDNLVVLDFNGTELASYEVGAIPGSFAFYEHLASIDEDFIDTNHSQAGFELVSAYPNPFNPTTTISYQLPASSSVLLTIYNLQGKFIEELVDGFVEFGLHEVVWNATNYSSGIYLVKLQTNTFSQTRKLVLMK